MKTFNNPLVLAALLTLVSAAAVQAAERPSTPDAPLASRVAALEKALDRLRLEKIMEEALYSHKFLDCASPATGEMQAKHSNLVFFVTCVRIEPFLEGYRVTVGIGNPYAADFSNASLTLFYGKTVEEALRDDRRVKVDFPNRLPSGDWVQVVFTVNPSRAEQLRSLALELEVGAVGLPARKPGT